MKTFKQHLTENQIVLQGVTFDLGGHFLKRLKERGADFSNNDFHNLLLKIRDKLIEIKVVGEFLFFSKSLNQGVVVHWDAFKERMKFITFLPKGRDYAREATEKVMLENIIKIFHID